MRTRDKGDTVQLSKVRIRETLRARLEQEAAEKRTTLNAIISDRLERSFQESDALGGVTLHSCFLVMADLAKSQSDHRGIHWLKDREVFDTVLREWTGMMRRLFRPAAPSKEG
jgi:hypothetical protein